MVYCVANVIEPSRKKTKNWTEYKATPSYYSGEYWNISDGIPIKRSWDTNEWTVCVLPRPPSSPGIHNSFGKLFTVIFHLPIAILTWNKGFRWRTRAIVRRCRNTYWSIDPDRWFMDRSTFATCIRPCIGVKCAYVQQSAAWRPILFMLASSDGLRAVIC